jgi:hypothetical protein
VQITYACVPAPQGGANEDRFRTGDGWALVLDGAGRYPGRTGGCVHPVTWVVEHLAGHISGQLATRDDKTLVEVVREGIRLTMADHGPTCDLTDPLSPGAALALVRVQTDVVEWLVLGDCAVAVERRSPAEPLVTIDDRVDHLPAAPITDAEVRTYDPDFVATLRNRPGGFWVAAASPEAADEALTGQAALADVRQVLVCSDGVTRLTERHGWTWSAMFEHAGRNGPSALVDAVRDADAADPDPRRWRGKAHDDATAALIRLAADEGE